MDILVAGASGSVGGELARHLDRPGTNLFRVSRSGEHAWTIGAEPAPESLRRHWDVIVNSAADTRWGLAPEAAREANTVTTSALIDLAGPDTHFVQISTIGVEGRDDVAEPDALEDFHNTYEWAKAKAEQVVRERLPNSDICRLPLVAGRSYDGFNDRFGGFFGLLRGLTSGALPAVVGKGDAYVDIASTDDAARLMTALIDAGRPDDHRVTVLGGGDTAPSLDIVMKTTMEAVNTWRARHDVPPLDQPPYVQPGAWDRFFLPLARKHLSGGQMAQVEAYAMFRPYFRRSHPLTVTHKVENTTDTIFNSVTHWCDRHVATAKRIPKPWTLIS